MSERERFGFPEWQAPLTEYQRAFERYHANPGSLATTAFLDRAITRLEAAYRRPGLFELGRVALSDGACEALVSGKHLAEEFLIRHKHGDWGLAEREDAALNRTAVRRAGEVTSRYQTRGEAELWISTRGDRSTTHLFTRDEY